MMPELGKYAASVLGSYAASIALLVLIVGLSLRSAARVRRDLDRAEGRDNGEG